MLVNTFTSLMEAMRRDNRMLVDEVATFVEEMRRITVLWDELWLGTLSQHAEELQKKVGAEFGFKHDLNMVLRVLVMFRFSF